MLNNLRKLGSTWAGKFFIGLLLIGVAGFGISEVITGFGANTVARVGDADITTRDFQRAYNVQLNAFSAQTGTYPTSEQALAFGIPSSVINRLASESALAQLGQRMGLGVSEDRLGQMLRDDPNFGGVLGQFDRTAFQRTLQQLGYTEAEYLAQLRQLARREQVVLSAFGDTALPETALELVNRYAADTRTLEYFVLSSAGMLPPDEPTPEEMASYLADNQPAFRTTPTRTAKLMVLTPDLLADSITLTDEEIAAEYERIQQSLVQAERRVIRQAALTTEAQQEAFRQGLQSVRSFDELVAETGVPVTDLGGLARVEISDTRLAETAFALQEGAFTIIPSAAGQRAVTVDEIRPGGLLTLGEARDQIMDRLRTARARAQFIEVLDQIEEFRAALRPLDEIAERFDLPLTEVTLTAGGSELSAVPQMTAEARRTVATRIFSARQGELAPSVAIGSQFNAWFDLMAVEPARDQTLAEVEEEVRAAILEERTQAQLEATAEELEERLRSGANLVELALGQNAAPETSEPVTRSSGSGALGGAVLDAAFSGPEGIVGSARNADGDITIFRVTAVTPAVAGTAEPARPTLEASLRDTLYSEFIAGLRDRAGVRISEQALMQLLALDTRQ